MTDQINDNTTLDPQRFGQFIKELRAERGLTQKQLAERLFVSDKAVSKWERGISMPEISLLLPLAQILCVSTTELLSGRRLPEEAPLTRPQVEELLNNTLRLSAGERAELQQLGRGRKLIILALALLGTAVNISVLLLLGFTPLQLLTDLGTVLLICGIFAVLSLFTMKEQLPAYYDENRITAYYQGPLRMNIPGLALNNSNWPYVLWALRLWCIALLLLYPPLYFAFCRLLPQLYPAGLLPLQLICVFSLFPTLYIVGNRH